MLFAIGAAYISCLLEPIPLQRMPQFTLHLVTPRRVERVPSHMRKWLGTQDDKRFHRECAERCGTDKGHLAPLGDMATVQARRLSMHIVYNTVPIRASVNKGNMEKVEVSIRKLVEDEQREVAVYTGQLGAEGREREAVSIAVGALAAA